MKSGTLCMKVEDYRRLIEELEDLRHQADTFRDKAIDRYEQIKGLENSLEQSKSVIDLYEAYINSSEKHIEDFIEFKTSNCKEED